MPLSSVGRGVRKWIRTVEFQTLCWSSGTRDVRGREMSHCINRDGNIEFMFYFQHPKPCALCLAPLKCQWEALMLIYHITRKCEVEVHSRQILETLFNKEEENCSMPLHQASSILHFIDYLSRWIMDIFRRTSSTVSISLKVSWFRVWCDLLPWARTQHHRSLSPIAGKKKEHLTIKPYCRPWSVIWFTEATISTSNINLQ